MSCYGHTHASDHNREIYIGYDKRRGSLSHLIAVLQRKPAAQTPQTASISTLRPDSCEPDHRSRISKLDRWRLTIRKKTICETPLADSTSASAFLGGCLQPPWPMLAQLLSQPRNLVPASCLLATGAAPGGLAALRCSRRKHSPGLLASRVSARGC